MPGNLVARLNAALDRVTNSDRTMWASVFVFSLAVFTLTAHWTTGNSIDTVSAYVPAWQLVHHHTLFLDNLPVVKGPGWWVHHDGHVLSSRMPGVILIAVPAQFLLSFGSAPAQVGGVLTAVLVASLGVANIAVLLRRLGSPRIALAAVTVLAFGTAVSTVAAAELWTHGPDLLWLSLALLALSRERYWLAGLAFAPMMLTRTHLAAAALVVGCWIAWRRRSLWPVLQVGTPALAGMALLVLWNHHVWGSYSLGGSGYSYAARNALHGHGTNQALQLAREAAGTLVSPMRGVLIYAPILLLAPVFAGRGWRVAPAWAQAAFLGGLGYEFVQLRIDSFVGGDYFFGNRLVIEPLVLCTPLLYCGYRAWAAHRPLGRDLAGFLALASVLVHVVGAFGPHGLGAVTAPWTSFDLWTSLQARGRVDGAAMLGAALVVLLVYVVAAMSRHRRRPVVEIDGLATAA